jgi:2-hydroxycyclohexanecarboxyl-CoA dehydrogenase
MKLKDQVAIITGGGRGMGRADCLLLAAEGATVICCDKIGESTRKVAAEVRERGGVAEAYELDITKPNDVARVVKEVAEKYKRIDVLVNNAGFDDIKPFIQTTEADWDFLIGLNLKGHLHVTRAVLPHMIERNYGTIVFIASDAGRVGSTGESVYGAAKAGLIGFTKSLAREEARHGIRVNCISPGLTDTPQFQANLADPKIGKIMRSVEKWIPLKRFGQPEEIAKAVLFFVSSDSSFVTGQVLSVSGGLTMI